MPADLRPTHPIVTWDTTLRQNLHKSQNLLHRLQKTSLKSVKIVLNLWTKLFSLVAALPRHASSNQSRPRLPPTSSNTPLPPSLSGVARKFGDAKQLSCLLPLG